MPPNQTLENLLHDLGPKLRRGADLRPPATRCSTGLPDIDAVLGGGIPRGRLSEISGPPSSGRTSLALSLLATTTANAELAAVVDLADALDPSSAQAFGVQLPQLLWARAKTWRDALRCTQRLLETQGFPLVLLDLPAGLREVNAASSAWLQLARLAVATQTALVVLSRERCTGTHAEVALEMQPARAHFSAAPALLEALETQAIVVRNRAFPLQKATSLRLGRTSPFAA